MEEKKKSYGATEKLKLNQLTNRSLNRWNSGAIELRQSFESKRKELFGKHEGSL